MGLDNAALDKWLQKLLFPLFPELTQTYQIDPVTILMDCLF